MKAKEYLKQSGYNENYPIGNEQICRLMEGFYKNQIKKSISSIKGENSALSGLTEYQRGKKNGLLRALEFLK